MEEDPHVVDYRVDALPPLLWDDDGVHRRSRYDHLGT